MPVELASEARSEPQASEVHERGASLLAIARGAIAAALGEVGPSCESAAWLEEKGASFVTLMQRGQLRGCVGSLSAERALRRDVERNARAAAFRDPRFAPLSHSEYSETLIEVSLLSPLEPIAFESESHALAQLRPGVDGLVLESGRRRSTFLPQVWEQLPEPLAFLAQLKHKAGLPPGFWVPDLKLSRYTVSKWREADLKPDIPGSEA
jgi:AmmeMemoRadiSam system protein A